MSRNDLPPPPGKLPTTGKIRNKITEKCWGNIIYCCKLNVPKFTPGLTTTPTEVTTRMIHEEGIHSEEY